MPNGQWRSSTRRSTLPPNWPSLRRAVLERDGFACQIRDPGCTGQATECDHINDRDLHTEANLRAACHRCHLRRSSSQGGRAAQAKRRKPERKHPGLL
jgi:5-methylcytosine-specific restriction protein A